MGELDRELEELDRQARQRSDESLERRRRDINKPGVSEIELLRAQNEKERRIRIRNAKAEHKRAITDIARAKATLSRKPPKSRSIPLNQTGRNDMFIEVQRDYVAARARQIEAERELRVLQAPVPRVPKEIDLAPSVRAMERREADAAARAGATGTGTAGTAGPATATTDREGQVGLTRAGISSRRSSSAAQWVPAGEGGTPTDRESIRQIQRDLNAKGARLVVDGIMGPKTRAAMARFGGEGVGAGGGVGVDGSSGVGAGGGAGVAPPSPGGALAPASSATDSDDDILAAYPQLAMFLKIPEVGDVLRQAKAEGWPEGKLRARVISTEWWRTTPNKSRAWMGVYALDPATAEREVENNKAKLKQLADDYFVPLSDVTLREWSLKVLSGEVPEDGFAQYIRQQAKSMRPSLSAAIDSGMTVATWVEPYRQVAAQTLEINPNDINFHDPRWQRPFNNIDPKTGEATAMSLSDWQSLLRTDIAYGFDTTNQAREQAARFATQLAEKFGRAA